MHGVHLEELLPGAFCVQRFGNRVILQLIPLIALCCVLQRNRKPSHPSRHVVEAVQDKNFFLSSGKTNLATVKLQDCLIGWPRLKDLPLIKARS
jgi:hypothetical protein